MQALGAGDPQEIGPYVVISLLGEGGMGRVYLGRDASGHEVAIKVVNADLARDPDFRKRFTREAAATAAVSGPSIAAVVDCDLDAERPWLATEYVPGPSLHARVSADGPMTAAQAQALGTRLAEALSAIHAAGLVHRDVKPPNILLGADGPRLIDFGIARDAAASTITRTGVVIGTPPYMSPEQIRGRSTIGPAADVFALGGVLAFAVTGRHPFGEAEPTVLAYRIAHEEPELDEIADDPLKDVILACLAKNDTERPTAAELVDRLRSEPTRPIAGQPAAPTSDQGSDSPARDEPDKGLVEPPAYATPRGDGFGDTATDPDDPAKTSDSKRRGRSALVAIPAAALVVVTAATLGHGFGPHRRPDSDNAAPSTSTSGGQSGNSPNPTGTPSPSPTGTTRPSPTPDQMTSVKQTGTSQSSNTVAVTTLTTGPGSTATTHLPGPTVTISHSNPAPTSARPPSQPAPPTSQPGGSPPGPVSGASGSVVREPSYTDETLKISWSAPANATSFEIHYTNSGDQFGDKPVDTTYSTAATSYSIPGIHPFQTVCFSIRALNKYGASSWDSGSPHCQTS